MSDTISTTTAGVRLGKPGRPLSTPRVRQLIRAGLLSAEVAHTPGGRRVLRVTTASVTALKRKRRRKNK